MIMTINVNKQIKTNQCKQLCRYNWHNCCLQWSGGEQSDWRRSEKTAGVDSRPEESTAGGKRFPWSYVCSVYVDITLVCCILQVTVYLSDDHCLLGIPLTRSLRTTPFTTSPVLSELTKSKYHCLWTHINSCSSHNKVEQSYWYEWKPHLCLISPPQVTSGSSELH